MKAFVFGNDFKAEYPQCLIRIKVNLEQRGL